MFFRKRKERQAAPPSCARDRTDGHLGSGLAAQGEASAQAAPAATSPSTHPGAGQASALAGLRGLRLLLAEDHETNASLLIEELAYFGAQVEHALDGELACHMLMSGARVDVILMDCQMPRMDGFEATQRIRAWEAVHGRPAVPIVALTGLSQEFEQSHAREAGMNAYLVKPFTALQLAMAIELVVPLAKATEIAA